MSKIYRVPVYYQVCEYVTVKADSAEDAINYVQENQSDIPVHPETAYYVDDSYEVETEDSVVMGYNEDQNDGSCNSWCRTSEPHTYNYYDATKVNSDSVNYLGLINIEEKIVVTDPGLSGKSIVLDSLPGTYKCTTIVDNDQNLKALVAAHETSTILSNNIPYETMEKYSISTVSGYCGIFNIDYYNNRQEVVVKDLSRNNFIYFNTDNKGIIGKATKDEKCTLYVQKNENGKIVFACLSFKDE